MGLTIRRGPDGLPIFSFEDAPAARRATPPPRPQRKIPPLIQYRYRAPKKVEPEPERPRALRQKREHTVTWPGPGLTGVSAGHNARMKSPQIAGWIPADEDDARASLRRERPRQGVEPRHDATPAARAPAKTRAHRDLAGPGPHGRVCRPRYASQVAADRGLDSL